MCGRYFIDEDNKAEELQRIIDLINHKAAHDTSLKTSGEISPTDTVPVIANSKSIKPTPFAMEWGYSTANGSRLINARSESASQKPTFMDGMLQRRCLIPASRYFEWEKRKNGKTKYAIGCDSDDLIYMAGIYRIENSKPRFCILTREPAESISFIHNRMPVILSRDILRDWLNPRFRADEILTHAVTDVNYHLA